MILITTLTSRTGVFTGGENWPGSIIDIFTIFVIEITAIIVRIQFIFSRRSVHRSITVPLVFISQMASFIENNSNGLEIKKLSVLVDRKLPTLVGQKNPFINSPPISSLSVKFVPTPLTVLMGHLKIGRVKS